MVVMLRLAIPFVARATLFVSLHEVGCVLVTAVTMRLMCIFVRPRVFRMIRCIVCLALFTALTLLQWMLWDRAANRLTM